MYKIGDKVLYGGEGICSINAIEDKKIADKKISYYILSPLKESNAVFYVPVEGKTAETKLRQLLTGDELLNIFKNAVPALWIENDRARRDEYKRAINEADREAIASFVKAVDLHKKEVREIGKKLHKLDEYFFVEVENLLYGELSSLFELKKDEVVPFILGEILPDIKK